MFQNWEHFTNQETLISSEFVNIDMNSKFPTFTILLIIHTVSGYEIAGYFQLFKSIGKILLILCMLLITYFFKK